MEKTQIDNSIKKVFHSIKFKRLFRFYIEKQYTRKELKARTKTKESTRIIQVSEKVLEILKVYAKEK